MTIAFGAAAATVVVVLGILAVPAVNACADDSRGFVTCTRDMIQQRFDLPGTVRTEALAPPPASSSPGPEPRLAVEAVPDMPATTEAAEMQPADTPLGQGGPFLPPEPMPPRYVPRMPDRIADLEPTRTSEPPPDRQIPPAATAPAAPVETDAAPVEAAEPLSSPSESLAQPTARDEGGSPEVTPAMADTVEPSQSRAPPPPDPVVEVDPLVRPSTPDAAQPPDPPPPEADIVEPPLADSATAPAPGPPQPEPVPEPPATPAPQDLVIAAGPELEPLQPVPPIAAPLALAPTIDAIELDGARSFVSGSGPAGALMRLFSDDEVVGESQVEEGRWLVETGPLLTVQKQELKIEALDPETGRSLGQSAITIEFELPADLPLPEEEPEPTPPEDTPPPAPREQRAPTRPPPPASPPTTEADPEQSTEPAFDTTADTLAPEAEAAPPLGAEPSVSIDEARPSEPSSQPSRAPLPPLVPVMPQRETDSVTILGAPDVAPSASTETPDDLASPLALETRRPSGEPVTILRLYAVGDPVYGRFSGGQAIVRRGDTLWTLARRYYGSGIHYRTILEANRHQIRRSSRIFPGQVLDLPLVTRD